jgi:hypothetical protein
LKVQMTVEAHSAVAMAVMIVTVGILSIYK